jgi:hypothetical protein
VTAVSGSAATATLILDLTLEEAQILAQALDLLASDPSRTAVRPLTSMNGQTSRSVALTTITPPSPRWVALRSICPAACMT